MSLLSARTVSLSSALHSLSTQSAGSAKQSSLRRGSTLLGAPLVLKNTAVNKVVKNVGMPLASFFSFGASNNTAVEADPRAQAADDDKPSAPNLQFASFGAGCFWGIELAYQRVPGVYKTEVGYTGGLTHAPSYQDVCSGQTGHVEAVRVEYDPNEVSYEKLLDVFWQRHNPTQLNRQGNDVGTQYRSGIYFYNKEQEEIAKASMEKEQAKLGSKKIVTELLPAKKWYKAENYHQQYLAKGGRMGFKQSAEKNCNDPIRCYG